MDWLKIRDQCVSFFKKYRYPIAVVLAGLLLMCLPGRTVQKEETPQTTEIQAEQSLDLQDSLEEVLSQIHGAGKVKVLLTTAQGAQTVYQTDEDGSYDPDSGSDRRETVIITDADRQESGLIRQVIGPIYQGAVVVCQGADKAGVRLAIVEAVSSVTGLGADHISVLKMK